MASDRISVLVKFPAPLLERIDASCEKRALSRTAWVLKACEDYFRGPATTGTTGSLAVVVGKNQRRVEPVMMTGRQLADNLGIQIGPRREAPGARLKEKRKWVVYRTLKISCAAS